MTLPFINSQLVFNYLSIRDDVGRNEADAIFVLGSGSIAPAIEAARLYHQGVARAICFTSVGGTFGGNIVFGEPEITAYAKWLSLSQIPASAVFYPDVDKGTTNTAMEAKAAIPFMQERLGRVRRVVLCSRGVHQRRAWATFRKQHPDVFYFNRPDHETLTVELLPRLVQEIDRLREYAAKGDIEPQEISPEVHAVCEQLRAHFPMNFPSKPQAA